MRVSRAVACLLLLALFLGPARAGGKCANCGLGEGVDACDCGNSVVRSHKLDKPEFFASPEAIKNALKLRFASIYAPEYATVYSPPTYAAYAAPAPIYSAPPSPYNAVPAPSPVSYALLPSPTSSSRPIRSRIRAETKCRDCTGNGAKRRKDNEDLVSLLSLAPGTSVAPKFEPIGDLCRCNKGKYGNGDGIVGVVPARPGKLPSYKPPKPKLKLTITPPKAYPAPVYSAPVPPYSAPVSSYSVPGPSYTPPAPSYSVPTSSYTAPVSSYNAPVPASPYSVTIPSYSATAYPYNSLAQYAPAYQTPAVYSTPPTPASVPYAPNSAQYTPANPQPLPQMIYVISPPPAEITHKNRNTECDRDKNKRETAPATPYFSPDSAHYAPARPQSSPQMIYVVGDVSSSSANEIYKKPKTRDCDKEYKEEAKITPVSYTPQYTSSYSQQPAQMVYVARDAPTRPDYEQNYAREVTIKPASAEHVPTYQQLAVPAALGAPTSYAAEAAPSAEKPCKKSKKPINYEKGEDEGQMLVGIELQREQAPRYTADPVSVSLAYKLLAESQGKKHVPEDTLAYGHYKEPADGRVDKRVSDFDEEKLHTVDKPVVELKYENGDLQISYSDIGFGPVAPSKNRFVPKTDDSANSPYGSTIVYVPPPEDKDSLPGGPLGPTVPGYKSGGVIHGETGGKPSCGCGDKTAHVKEGSRRAVLVDAENNDSEEYEGGGNKGGIMERIKSSSCSCKQSEY